MIILTTLEPKAEADTFNTVKMAAPADLNLTANYIELNKLGNKGEFAKAIKVAKKSKLSKLH